ncbi:Mov34/MPN/PAD-1 family protein [Oscillospiraceae bacterium OttesenSCG-928-F05]|nr:Mov34/MPN/PAD-1 family protein [Oscillospiraceae bacterium OttesenSCG-928-F05]
MSEKPNSFPDLDLGSDGAEDFDFLSLDTEKPSTDPQTRQPEDASEAAAQPSDPGESDTDQIVPSTNHDPDIPEETEKAVQAAAAPAKGQKAAENPIMAALDKVESKEAETAQQNLFSKAPLFMFAGANERIENADITFEALRQQKTIDFPEMEAKKTNWTVEYGAVSKAITAPGKEKIADVKRSIETSQDFITKLKKAKDKNPDCIIRPRITSEKKGELPSYKGVFPDMPAAVAGQKLISIVPSRNGTVYQMRSCEMGRFITPTSGHPELSDIKAGFEPALPPVPADLLWAIITFFRSYMFTAQGAVEVSAHILWDKVGEAYVVSVPEQSVSRISVEAVLPDYDTERYIDYISIHSHNTMPARFSKVDDADEQATRVYAVVGRLQDYFPQMAVRISNGGHFHEIDPHVVFEPLAIHFPGEWRDNVQVGNAA